MTGDGLFKNEAIVNGAYGPKHKRRMRVFGGRSHASYAPESFPSSGGARLVHSSVHILVNAVSGIGLAAASWLPIREGDIEKVKKEYTEYLSGGLFIPSFGK